MNMWNKALFCCCFANVQDSWQERNERSLRASTLRITNTGSPAFGSPTWRLLPAVRAGSKTITHSNYCWRCTIKHTHTHTHSHYRNYSWTTVQFMCWLVLTKIQLEMCIHTDIKTDSAFGLNVVKWHQKVTISLLTGAECIQREV